MGDEQQEPRKDESVAQDESDDLELEEVEADQVVGGATRQPFTG